MRTQYSGAGERDILQRIRRQGFASQQRRCLQALTSELFRAENPNEDQAQPRLRFLHDLRAAIQASVSRGFGFLPIVKLGVCAVLLTVCRWEVAAQTPMTNIAEIKALSVEDVRKVLPVRVRGVITASTRWMDAFLQNESGAIYLASEDLLKPLKIGDLVEVDGVTDPGGFAPIILPRGVRMLGQSKLPAPVTATHASLADGRLDSERVVVVAKVMGIAEVGRDPRMNLMLPDGPVTALLINRSTNDLPARLRGATVRLTGISAPGHNTHRQATTARMLVTPLDEIEILQPGPESFDQIPITAIGDLMRFKQGYSRPDLLRIQGIVTAVPSSEVFFVQDETGSVLAALGQEESTVVRSGVLGDARIRPGDRVEVVGGPFVERLSVVFRVDEVKKLGRAELPAPATVTAETLAQAAYDWKRVAFEGRVVAVGRSVLHGALELTLSSGKALAVADMPNDSTNRLAPVMGSLVRVAGVLDNRAKAERNSEVSVIHVARSDDLTVLAGPTANPARLLAFILGGVAVVGGLAFAWAFTLKRQVKARTDALLQVNAQLKESQDRQALTIQATHLGLWDWDVLTGKVIWSGAHEALWGYAPGEFTGTVEGFMSRVHPDDKAGLMAESERSMQQNVPCRWDYRVVWPDGSVHWMSSSGKNFVNAEGKVCRIIGTVQDITERKLVEEEMARTRNTLVEAQRIAHLGSFEYVAATRTTVWSEEEYRIYGLEPTRPSPTYDEMLAHHIHPDDAAFLHETFTKAMQTQAVYELEHRIVRPDGSVRWVYDRAQPYLDSHGELVRYVGTTLDITGRKQAEAALRESEERLQFVVRGSQLGLWDWNIVTGDVQRNERWAEMLGFTLEEIRLTVKQWSDLVHPDDCAAAWKSIDDHLQGRTAGHACEYRMRTKAGDYRWVLDQARVMARDEQGRPLRMSGTHTDITQRKQAEEALRDSEARFRTLVEKAPEAIFIQTQRRFAYVNAAAVRLFGAAGPEQLLGEMVENRMHPDCRDRVRERIRLLNEQRLPQPPADLVFIQLDGSLRDVSVSGVPFEFKGEKGALVFARDITARKRSDEALVSSQERLQLAMESAQAGAWEWFLATGMNIWSEELWGLYGLAPRSSPASYETWRNTIHPDDLVRTEQNVMKAAAEGRDIRLEYRTRTADGGERWLMSRGKPFFGANGKLERYVGIVLDITDRVRAEKEWARLFTAIEQSMEAVVITDVDANILYVNPAFEKTTGYTKGEALGKNPSIMKSGQHDAAFYDELWRSLRETGVWRGRFTNRHKGGKLFYEDATISAIHDAEGKTINYVAVKHDVTREVQLEAQFRQAQKLEAIGQLAGGVAHDFNNILAAIVVQIGLMQTSPATNREMNQALEDMERTAMRGSALTKQLTMFSRRSELELTPLGLNGVVTNIHKMLTRLIGMTIKLGVEASAELPSVEGNVGTLEQVITNLVVNARDAMPKGGTITLRTSVAEFGEADLGTKAERRKGRFVCLEVSDTGTGMDAATLERIYEPFFTTKPVGKGTGLGLATVHGIVRQHRGWLEVESTVGKGTTFHVYLPALAYKATTISQVETATMQLQSAGETILLVEDDEDLRSAAEQTLKSLGYRMHTAVSGRQALELWPTISQEVDLVFTDVMMPDDVSGLELAERLLEQKPGLKVIVSSAHSLASSGLTVKARSNLHFLPKPYSTRDLSVLLRRCLEAKAPAVQAAPETVSPPPLSREMVAVIPAALAESILAAAIRGRRQQLLQLLEEVTRIDSQLGPRLYALGMNFDYEKLIALFKPEKP